MSEFLKDLNPAQREAVTHTIGPLLIIAGPGSGKTRTVVHSIAYAIENGEDPSKIAAFTFTRKAAEELKERVGKILTRDVTNNSHISTFHSFCGSVVNIDFDSLCIDDEQEFIVKELTHCYEERKRAEIDYIQYHNFPESDDILRFIRLCKAKNIDYSNAGSSAKEYVPDPQMLDVYVDIYKKYEQLEDDGNPYTRVQLLTYALFRDFPEVKAKWQGKFSIIFVDEYQDTDPVQYGIIKSLAERHQNLRVVGDDDQGIYGWRGADIQNILNFEQDYSNAKVIRLGQNYRSTEKIVEISRALAEFNPDRRDKELFTRNFEGEKVKYLHCDNDEEEAATIASFIQRSIDQGDWQPSDFAVLYRTNKQAHVFKTAFSDLGIPYHTVGDSLDGPATGISLMTIHKSKGLEFPNVFVTGICQDLLPHYYNSDEKDWPEELRLLYVAMTRAKNWLCLSSYEEEGEFQRKRGQSPFLEQGYIPSSLLESVETLENVRIPPSPPAMTVPVTIGEYVEPLPEKLLGDGMTVLGIDPGIQNVGWSIAKKSPIGYTVIKYGTQTTRDWRDTLLQTKDKINELIIRYRPHAIAIEKLEGATEDWFRYVAGCVATIRSIADQHGIECRLYTPQEVKSAATNNRNACKEDVQKGVKSVCNLPQIPEPHHSADAIATSLCYLRSYLNSSRFEGNKRKQEHYEVGCDYLDKKQYEAAIDKFKETINIDPLYTEAHCGLGRTYLVQNDLDRAETAAKTALRLTENNHPDSQKLLGAITHYRSGCNFLKNSEWNVAIDKFQKSTNLEPIFTEAHCELSRAYFEIDNLEAAKNAAQEALKLRYEYPPAQKLLVDIKKRYYDNGEICFNREEYRQAIFEFQKAVEIDKNFKDAHRFVGEAYLKLGDLEKAEKSARDALDIDRNYELAQDLLEKIKQKHKEHGDNYRNRKAYAEALISYQHAIRIDDKYKEAYNNLGIVYRNMQEYDRSITAYQKAIDIDGRCQVTHNNLSIVYRKIGEYTEAVNSLNRAIAIKRDYQTAYYNLAYTYFKMENLQAASEAGLEALKLNNNDEDTLKLLKNIQDAYLREGRNYFRQDNLEAAESSARAALRLDRNYQPSHIFLDDIKRAYYELAFTSFEQNEWEAAEKFAKEALRIDPIYQRANVLLQAAYFEQGIVHIENERYVKGINKLQEAKDIDPNCEKTHYHLGLAYFKLDRLKEAQMMTEKALSIQPNYPPARELLTEIKDARNWLKVGGTKVRELARWIANRIGF